MDATDWYIWLKGKIRCCNLPTNQHHHLTDFSLFFVSAPSCPNSNLYIKHDIYVRAKKWPRVWPPPTSPNFFFWEKTGSGKSGKNPDVGFWIFGIRFWKRTTKNKVLWGNFKVFLKISRILTFLTQWILRLHALKTL